MRMWKRASGALKDQTTIWHANLTRRTALRNPDLDKAVIRATTHHDSSLDRRHIDHLCDRIRLSHFNLKPILWSISHRVTKTRSWAVALKALHLMHAVLNSRAPAVKKIGRLPFDLSAFRDGHLPQARAWPLNAFIRAYYTYLDQKSTVAFQHAEDTREEFVMMHELFLLQKLQQLIDLLVQIRPVSRAASVPLILHVMDDVIIETYDVYSRICRGIAIVLMNIHSAGEAEATMALDVVQKAAQQGEDLMDYFEQCAEIGDVDASEFPVLDRVPDEGIRELEQIVRSFGSSGSVESGDRYQEGKDIVMGEAESSSNDVDQAKSFSAHNWEKFDDDFAAGNRFGGVQEVPDLIML